MAIIFPIVRATCAKFVSTCYFYNIILYLKIDSCIYTVHRVLHIIQMVKRSTPDPSDALLELPLVLATCSPEKRTMLKESVEALPIEMLKAVLAANQTLSEVDRNILYDAFVKHKACDVASKHQRM